MKPGDLVKLKSGGPAMVIEEILDELAFTCWIDQDGNPRKKHFVLCALEIFTK